MRRRGVIVAVAVAVLGAGVAAFVLLHGPSPAPAASGDDGEPPLNVVLLSMDTTRRDHVSFHGYDKDTTPELERLVADRGIVFDAAVAAHTNTAPSHASMLTGLYPATHGVRRNGMKLPDDLPHLAEMLSDRGWATGGFISGWTLSDHTKLQRGFDVYDTTLPGDGRRKAELTFAAAKPWVREQIEDGEAFFLFFHLFDPHFPYDPPKQDGLRFLPDGKKEFSTHLNRHLPRQKDRAGLTPEVAEEYVARYDGEIRYADRYMGKLLDMLEETGVADNTLVVFLSDHGDTHYERHWIFDHGGRAYDEQILVPMAIRMPKDAHAGKRIEAQVGHVDIMPTILEVLGVEAPESVAGRSLVPLIEGEADKDAAERPAFAQSRPEPARVPEVDAPISKKGLVSAIRLPSIKLIEYPTSDGGWYRQLFDLQQDPGETTNAAEERTKLAEELHQELSRWRAATGGEERQAPPELSPNVEEELRSLGYVE